MSAVDMPEGRGDETNTDLHARAAGGDRGAVGALLLRHAGAAYAGILSRTGRRGETEDLLQETLRRAVAGIGTLQEPDRFGSWLYGIAIRVCSERFRKRPAAGLSLEALRVEPQAPATEAPSSDGRLDRLSRGLGALSESDREVLVLHHMKGLDYEALGRLLGLSRAGVSQRLSRARTRLRERMVALEKEDR